MTRFQDDQGRTKKLLAVYVREASSNDDKIAQIHDGKFQVVLFSAELLLTCETWRDMLQSPVYKEHLVGFIVDEAHCVKKWHVCNTLMSLEALCYGNCLIMSILYHWLLLQQGHLRSKFVMCLG